MGKVAKLECVGRDGGNAWLGGVAWCECGC